MSFHWTPVAEGLNNQIFSIRARWNNKKLLHFLKKYIFILKNLDPTKYVLLSHELEVYHLLVKYERKKGMVRQKNTLFLSHVSLPKILHLQQELNSHSYNKNNNKNNKNITAVNS